MEDNSNPIEAASLADMLMSNPELIGMDDGFKEFIDKEVKAKTAPPPAEPTPPAPKAQIAKDEPDADEPEPEGDEPEEEATDPAEPKSIFFQNKAKKSAFKTVEDAQKAFQKTYDIKFDDPDSLTKLYENTKEWRNASQKLPEVETKLNAIVEDLQNLPPHLSAALAAYASGQNEIEAWNNAPKQFDFSKPFDAIPKAEIIKYYYPGEFSDEDIADPDDVAINAAYAKAKPLFNSDKRTLERQRIELENKTREQNERFSTSVKDSVGALQKTFPGLDNQRIKRVEKILSGGVQSVISNFVNGDGTFKKDAGMRLALALYGDEEIKARDGVIDKTNAETFQKVKAAKSVPGEDRQTHAQPPQDVPMEILDMSRGIQKTYY